MDPLGIRGWLDHGLHRLSLSLKPYERRRRPHAYVNVGGCCLGLRLQLTDSLHVPVLGRGDYATRGHDRHDIGRRSSSRGCQAADCCSLPAAWRHCICSAGISFLQPSKLLHEPLSAHWSGGPLVFEWQFGLCCFMVDSSPSLCLLVRSLL